MVGERVPLREAGHPDFVERRGRKVVQRVLLQRVRVALCPVLVLVHLLAQHLSQCKKHLCLSHREHGVVAGSVQIIQLEQTVGDRPEPSDVRRWVGGALTAVVWICTQE